MGAVAGPSKAFQRLLRIAAVPTAAFLVFAAVWLLDRWGVLSASTGLHAAGGLGFPGFAAVSTAIAARRGRGRQRQAWLVMTFGLVALVFGAMAVVYHRFFLGNDLTLYPPTAMIAFLLFPTIACVALLMSTAAFLTCGLPAFAQDHNSKILAGFFEEWSIYYAGYNLANLESNGSAAKLSHLIYAFGDVSASASAPATDTCVIADAWADFENKIGRASCRERV